MALFPDEDEAYSYDIHRANVPSTPEELGQLIASQIGQKGYCVVDSRISLGIDHLEEALIEARSSDRPFKEPPEEVIQGVLGDEGTGRLCEIPAPGTADSRGMAALSRLDTFLTEVLHCVTPSFNDLWISSSSSSRTVCLLAEGGSASGISGKATALTEKSCAKWLNIFLRHKLMMLLYLGPDEGTLTLWPYAATDSPVDDELFTEITTKPGMLILLRADYLGHHHVCSDRDYMLCTYMLGPDLVGGRGPRNEMKGLGPVIPAAKALTEWAMNRALVLKDQIVADGALGAWNSKVPRSWERAMNHMYCTGRPLGIFGQAIRTSGPHGADDLWTAMATGVDFVTSVPPTRWQHDTYYDPDPESYKKSNLYNCDGLRTSIKHMAYTDGMELFDCKFFNISPAEAKSMDPNQRQILETSYGALHQAGYTKKELNNAYIGVFGGSTAPEFAVGGFDLGNFGAGTGTSEAIFANRVSFCLGMMGPSTNIDCEMASASCAFFIACSQVAPTNWRHDMAGLDNPAALANAGYCMLTPIFWPRFEYWMNPIGRCFTFDDDAGGYVRGEGAGSFLLKSFCHKVDEQWTVADQSPLGMCQGYRMNNNGRNAGFQAPNAAAEQEAVSLMLRQACISPLDVDAQECHGIGSLLQDAVEAGAAARVYRGTQGSDSNALMLGAVKTQVGAQSEFCGFSSIVKAVWSQRWGSYIGSLHLRVLNAHIELEDRPVLFHSEPLSYQCRASYHAVASRGIGGTNCNLLFWNKAPEEQVRVTGHRPCFRQENWLQPLPWDGTDGNAMTNEDAYYEAEARRQLQE